MSTPIHRTRENLATGSDNNNERGDLNTGLRREVLKDQRMLRDWLKCEIPGQNLAVRRLARQLSYFFNYTEFTLGFSSTTATTTTTTTKSSISDVVGNTVSTLIDESPPLSPRNTTKATTKGKRQTSSQRVGSRGQGRGCNINSLSYSSELLVINLMGLPGTGKRTAIDAICELFDCSEQNHKRITLDGRLVLTPNSGVLPHDNENIINTIITTFQTLLIHQMSLLDMSENINRERHCYNNNRDKHDEGGGEEEESIEIYSTPQGQPNMSTKRKRSLSDSNVKIDNIGAQNFTKKRRLIEEQEEEEEEEAEDHVSNKQTNSSGSGYVIVELLEPNAIPFVVLEQLLRIIKTRVYDFQNGQFIPPHLKFIIITTTTLKEHIITSTELMVSRGLLPQQPSNGSNSPNTIIESTGINVNHPTLPNNKSSSSMRTKKRNPVNTLRRKKISRSSAVAAAAAEKSIYETVDYNPKAVGLHRVLMDLQTERLLPLGIYHIFHENLNTLIARNPNQCQFINWIKNYAKDNGNITTQNIWFDLIPLDTVRTQIQTNLSSLVQPVKGHRLTYTPVVDLFNSNSFTSDYSYIYEPTRQSLCDHAISLYRQDFTKNWKHYNHIWINTIVQPIFHLKEAAKAQMRALVSDNLNPTEMSRQMDDDHSHLSNFNGCLLFSINKVMNSQQQQQQQEQQEQQQQQQEQQEQQEQQQEKQQEEELLDRMHKASEILYPFLPNSTFPLEIQCQLCWQDTTPKTPQHTNKRAHCNYESDFTTSTNATKVQRYMIGSQEIVLH